MKVIYTSDLHADNSEKNRRIIPLLYDHLISEKPDLFVIAGDMANSSEEISSALSVFKDLTFKKIFVPGNHDLWIDSKNKLKSGFDSSYKYEEGLKNISICNDFIYPLQEPYIFDDYAIIGTAGWYDYSLRDKRLDCRFDNRDYDAGEFGNMYWSDCSYSVWLADRESSDWKRRSVKLNNTDVFRMIYDQFSVACSKVPASIKNIIVIIHTAPFESCMIRKEVPDPFDAYEGSSEYGNFILKEFKNRKVTIFTGHKHSRLDLQITPEIRILRAPFGYLNQEVKDLNELFLDRIGLAEL